MRASRDIPRAPQNSNLVRVFEQAHFIEQPAQVVLALRALRAKADSGPHLVELAIDLRLETLVSGKRKPDGFLVGQQGWHFFIQCFDAKSLVDD